MTTILLHGSVGYWDEIGTVIAIVSFVVLTSFLAWSSGKQTPQSRNGKDAAAACNSNRPMPSKNANLEE